MARRFSFFVLLALAALAPRRVNAEEGDVCFPDWSVAAPVVQREGLVPVEELTQRAQGRMPGSIVKTNLCRENGRYVYRLVVREPSGRLARFAVDARHPFEP